MKNIFVLFLLIVSFQSFGQTPTGHQVRKVNERIQGEFIVDSAFTLPRYTDTTAANLDKAFDTCGKMFFSYAKDSVYYRACNPKRWITVGSGSGGGGTINPGTTGKPAYYIASTTLDDFAAVDYALTGTNVKVTALNATDIPLQVKAAGSQTANLTEWSSSGGTGDLAIMTENGYLESIRVGAGGLALTPLTVYGSFNNAIRVIGNSGTLGVGVELDAFTSQGGLNWNIAAIGSGGSAPAGSWAIYNNTLSAYRMFQASSGEFTVGQDFFSTSTMFNVKSKDASTDVARFHGFEDDDAVLGLWADEGDNDADKWYIASNKTNNNLTFTNHTTLTAQLTTLGINIPNGIMPTSGSGGTDSVVARNSSTGDFYLTAGIGGTMSKGAYVGFPTALDSIDMWQTQVAITVSSLKAVLRGTATPSVTYNIKFGTDISSATSVFTSDITCTSITTGCSNNSGFNDATIPAGSFIYIVVTAQSGTVKSIGLTLNYTED